MTVAYLSKTEFIRICKSHGAFTADLNGIVWARWSRSRIQPIIWWRHGNVKCQLRNKAKPTPKDTNAIAAMSALAQPPRWGATMPIRGERVRPRRLTARRTHLSNKGGFALWRGWSCRGIRPGTWSW